MANLIVGKVNFESGVNCRSWKVLFKKLYGSLNTFCMDLSFQKNSEMHVSHNAARYHWSRIFDSKTRDVIPLLKRGRKEFENIPLSSIKNVSRRTFSVGPLLCQMTAGIWNS